MINFKNFVLFSLCLITFFSCKPKEKQTVCAKWSDKWYEAEIVSETGGKIHVIYSDRTEADLTAADIKYPLEKEKIKVGERVLAVWTTGLYYEGTVEEVKTEGATIKWDDGSTPSLVAYGKIVQGFPKLEKLTYESCKGKGICAKWSGSWYEAKIINKTDNNFRVIYSDGTEGDVAAADTKELITDKTKIAVNDKVLAVWTSGMFYEGTVLKIEDAGATIKWNDGSSPSLVTFGKIAK